MYKIFNKVITANITMIVVTQQIYKKTFALHIFQKKFNSYEMDYIIYVTYIIYISYHPKVLTEHETSSRYSYKVFFTKQLEV